MIQVKYTKAAAEDIEFWREKNHKIYHRIHALIQDITVHPFAGIGKPEPLKHILKGKWSRRINQEHRIVYEVTGREIIIYQCRYHYDSHSK